MKKRWDKNRSAETGRKTSRRLLGSSRETLTLETCLVWGFFASFSPAFA